MTRAELKTELLRRIRNARANARAEQTVHDAFIEEYQQGLAGSSTASKETHARSMELYSFTMMAQANARQFLRDAQFFFELLDVVEEGSANAD